MRPMYFSHKKTEKTRLFGFGLASSKPKEDPVLQEESSKRVAESAKVIVKIALQKYGIGSSICAWLCQKCCSKGKTVEVNLEDE